MRREAGAKWNDRAGYPFYSGDDKARDSVRTNTFTDGLAAVAAGIAVISAMLLLTGYKGIEQDTIYHELTRAELASPAKFSLGRMGG